MKEYYHVSSHGLESNDIFKSTEDFISGMNDVAIAILGFDIKILCFCLMSNHFHFVLYGTLEECQKFSDTYKHRCAMRMRYSSGEVNGLKDVNVQIDKVDGQEYLENVIAYVLRNPLAAGIMVIPLYYRWSSASCYFIGNTKIRGERLNEMSLRKRISIVKSRTPMPSHYMVDESGIIMPSCYVDVKAVENIFRHPSRLMMLLAKKVENEVEIQLGTANSVSMTDQEILTLMPELIRNEFKQDSISQLSMEQRIKLCLLLKRNFRAGIKQISRVTRLSPELVAKVV